jgi:hypothetical protein
MVPATRFSSDVASPPGPRFRPGGEGIVGGAVNPRHGHLKTRARSPLFVGAAPFARYGDASWIYIPAVGIAVTKASRLWIATLR